MRVGLVVIAGVIVWLAWRRYRVVRADENFTRYNAAVRRRDIAAVLHENKHHIARMQAEQERNARRKS